MKFLEFIKPNRFKVYFFLISAVVLVILPTYLPSVTITFLGSILFILLLFYTVPIRGLVIEGILSNKHIGINEWSITPISPVGWIITIAWFIIGTGLLLSAADYIFHRIKKIISGIYKLIKEKNK